MFDRKKEVCIEVTIGYDYDSDLKQIKELIKEITDLKGVKTLEVSIDE